MLSMYNYLCDSSVPLSFWGMGYAENGGSRIVHKPYIATNHDLPKRQGSLGNVGIIDLYLQIFKPITTALRQVKMRRIACTIQYNLKKRGKRGENLT